MTAKAVHVGTSAWPFFHTYPRSWIVWMIDAQVEGRPMPSSSSRLTSDASVYRAGGDVVWPSGVIDSIGTTSPSASGGSSASCSASPSAAASRASPRAA